MKHVLPAALLLTACLAFSACSDTNDRGVIIDRPFSLFGSATNAPVFEAPSAPVAEAAASASVDTRS